MIENSSQEEEYEDDKVVETSPGGTYVRFDHKLGSGAYKNVYRALDTEKGIEVAWNQVPLDRLNLDKDKILREIEFFKKIRHKHVIDFYHFWTDKNQVVFTTELMPSGTLSDYIEKSPEIKLKIIKSWCKQVLSGLNYLHTQDPPIIHRDIKCANIFINGTTEGEVKIGDLGLATFCAKKDALSVIGTPEFMAPEFYNEVYSTSVDIWAFGMAMIEMLTRQCPYAECDNVGQIFRKVTTGIRPQQLDLIKDSHVREFVALCLADESERPSAEELLDHPFFNSDGENDNAPVQLYNYPSSNNTITEVTLPNEIITTEITTIVGDVDHVIKQFNMNVVNREGDQLEVKAEIGIEFKNSKETSEIDFQYDLKQDTPEEMALDMVQSLELQPTSYTLIRSAFDQLVQTYSSDFDRTQTITELSELISDESEVGEISISDDLLSLVDYSENSNTTVSRVASIDDLELESLIEEDEEEQTSSELTSSTSLSQLVDYETSDLSVSVNTFDDDVTELEDLLDDDSTYEDSDSECGSIVTTNSEDILSDCSSSEEDKHELEILKAKHEAALRNLMKTQQDELRFLTERQARRRSKASAYNTSLIDSIDGEEDSFIQENEESHSLIVV